jgi:Ca2+-binding RTX toxin-like protein
MVAISYAWSVVVDGFQLNDETAGNQSDVAIAATGNGGYLGAWSVGSADVRGRYVDADGTPGAEGLLNTTTSGNQFDASIALQVNGRNVMSYTDSSSGTDTVRVRILGLSAPGDINDFAVPSSLQPQRESDVAGLTAGFAVAYTSDFGSGDTDITVQRYNADGNMNGAAIIVDNNSSLATDHASIARLSTGGFVVAWEQSAKAGGDHSVWFQLYDAVGARVTAPGDVLNSHHLIDNAGSINQDIQIAVLQDGGFVVAYADNGWDDADGTEITAQVFNYDGSTRSTHLRVNTSIAGDQLRPTVTVLSNGYFTVGWRDGDTLVYQAYTPQGVAIGSNYVPHNTDVVEAEIAALADGQVANVRESAFSDGDGSSIRSSVHVLTRTTLGTAVDELLSGDGLRDLMNGDAGKDLLQGNGADDVLLGAAGDDTLVGGAGADELDGGADDDQLFGSDADDALTGGAGADALDGGAGTDTAVYGGAAGVTVDLAAGTGSGGDAAGDTLTGIENVTGSQFADVLVGNAGANRLNGRFGADVLRGGAGADTLDGGFDVDTASYYTGSAGVTVDLDAGTGSGGDAAGDTLSAIENLSGSQGSDTLVGNAGANKLQGWNGNDVLRGGAGADVMEGGAGTDAASYYTGTVGVTVDLAAGTASGGDAAGDTLTGIENLSGSQGHDVLAGNAGANKLQGWNGDDVLRGGAGADTLEGGAGSDTASWYTSTAGVAVSLAAGTASGGEAVADALNSIENLSGSNLGNDGLEGNAGANVLQGWGGNDALVGGGGKDTLTGGSGADRIYFMALTDSVVGANADVITDFSHGQADRIDLTAIDANTAVAGNQAFGFIGTGLYTGVAGQLRYAITNGITTIAGDVNGDKVSDFHITASGTVNLIALDFVL